jgi:hypothetical protein
MVIATQLHLPALLNRSSQIRKSKHMSIAMGSQLIRSAHFPNKTRNQQNQQNYIGFVPVQEIKSPILLFDICQ